MQTLKFYSQEPNSRICIWSATIFSLNRPSKPRVLQRIMLPLSFLGALVTMAPTTQHELQLARRMSRLGTETAFEVLNKARALERQGKSIIHLEIGEPDFDTPANVIGGCCRRAA